MRDILADVVRCVCTVLRGERLCTDVVRNPALMEGVAECLSYVEDRGELLSLTNRVQVVRDYTWGGGLWWDFKICWGRDEL